jgi:hypothetical protein
MRNDTILEAVESRLVDAVALALSAEDALAETAGLLSEAEARFVQLMHPGVTLPPPPR